MAFVDTSGLYAVLDADDGNHAAARRTWTQLLERGDSVETTNYVIVECVALIQHRLGLAALRTFVSDVLPVVRTAWVTTAAHDAALQAVLSAGRRDLSLVDCTSFAVMRQNGVDEVFAFDRHFVEQGFRVLPG
ncbi:MAG TPA: PIN domain-containing protein [Longimicrobiales bacterium]|nr:PIN domain-containing protein [Longimicrobiales bacterium]